MAAVLKLVTTRYALPGMLSKLKASGYLNIKIDLDYAYGHMAVKAWGGDLRKWKDLNRKRAT